MLINPANEIISAKANVAKYFLIALGCMPDFNKRLEKKCQNFLT